VIRTLIADRMALIRAGLVACISRERDIEVVAELDRRELVLPTVAALQPDVAVVDDAIAAPASSPSSKTCITPLPPAAP